MLNLNSVHNKEFIQVVNGKLFRTYCLYIYKITLKRMYPLLGNLGVNSRYNVIKIFYY